MPLLLQATTRKRASSRWTNVNKRNQLRTPWNFPVNVWFTPIQNYLPIERVYSWILLNRTTTNTSMMNSFPLYFRFFILTINAIKKQLCGLLQCLTDNTIPHLFLVNWPVFFLSRIRSSYSSVGNWRLHLTRLQLLSNDRFTPAILL